MKRLYNRYAVFENGTIGTLTVNGGFRPLKPSKDKDGYLFVGLRVKGKTIPKKVHRLIAESYIPNPDNKPCVNHKDLNRANNNVSNLEWCTHKENTNHSFQNGGGKRKLNITQVKEIKEKLQEEHSLVGLAKEYEVHPCTISDIKQGRNWSFV